MEHALNVVDTAEISYRKIVNIQILISTLVCAIGENHVILQDHFTTYSYSILTDDNHITPTISK